MRFFWKPTPGVRFEDDDEERDVVVHVVVSIHLAFCIFVSPRCVAYFLRLSLSLSLSLSGIAARALPFLVLVWVLKSAKIVKEQHG